MNFSRAEHAADKYPDLKQRMDYELVHMPKGCSADCPKAAISRKYHELALARDRQRKPVL